MEDHFALQSSGFGGPCGPLQASDSHIVIKHPSHRRTGGDRELFRKVIKRLERFGATKGFQNHLPIKTLHGTGIFAYIGVVSGVNAVPFERLGVVSMVCLILLL